MPVPVSLRPDRREQTFVKGRGWVHYTETREYRRKKQREEARAAKVEEQVQVQKERQRKRDVSDGFALLFGGEDGGT